MADETTTSGGTVQCVIVTPERTVLDEPAEFVVVPMFDGEVGILPHRAPLIGRLGLGELRSTSKGVTKRYYVEGGFVQVRKDVVSVLTPKAVPVESIDAAAVERQLPTLTGPALAKAKAQLHVARVSPAGTNHY
jgi:F-type H+-transporting ATPase subunit epsilon